jgi:Cys-rich protein (TIGR01571 family)
MLTECSPTEKDRMNFEMGPITRNPIQNVDEGRSVTLEEPAVPQPLHKWNTRLCACNLDEETSWWGTWCCYLVQARTVHSFELDTSQSQLNYFWGYIAAVIMSFLVLGPGVSILFAIIGAVLLAWNRATLRRKIREKLSIPGSFCDDFNTHLCCSCCAVCQEVCLFLFNCQL